MKDMKIHEEDPLKAAFRSASASLRETAFFIFPRNRRDAEEGKVPNSRPAPETFMPLHALHG
jgi:hypothetical protein